MAISSHVLDRELNKNTDLTLFAPADLDKARTQWVIILDARMRALDAARSDVRNDFDYGGAAAICGGAYSKLEESVDEARRMVYALSTEMRRRSEGELPVWQAMREPVVALTADGMIKASSCEQEPDCTDSSTLAPHHQRFLRD